MDHDLNTASLLTSGMWLWRKCNNISVPNLFCTAFLYWHFVYHDTSLCIISPVLFVREAGSGSRKQIIFSCWQFTPWLIYCLFVFVCVDGLQQLHLKFDIILMSRGSSTVTPPPRPIQWCMSCHRLVWFGSLADPEYIPYPLTTEGAGPAPASNGWAPWWEEPHPREGWRGCIRSSTSD